MRAVAFGVLFGGLFVWGFQSGVALAQSPASPARTISVTGEAEIRVVPDQVLLSMSAETRGKDLAETQDKNDRSVKALYQFLTKDLDIETRHIKTDFTNVSPSYRSCNYNDEMSGRCSPLEVSYYSVRKGIQIRLNDLERYEDLTSKALQMGVTHINNVQFITTELRKHRDQARDMAAKAAKEKAEAVAKVLGMKVLKPISINFDQNHSFYFGGYGMRGRNSMMQNSIRSAPAAGSGENGSTLALGQINITAKVHVVFEIE